MRIYTRTGDAGETALFGGGRVKKAHPRVNAYGTIDELNSVLGLAIALTRDPEIRDGLQGLQHDLFVIGAILATPPSSDHRPSPSIPALSTRRVERMEGWIDSAEGELAPLREFILPGGTPGASALHHARTVCRRAEREVVALGHDEPLESEVVRFLNRLSDLLFTLARLENARAGVPDVTWVKEEPEG